MPHLRWSPSALLAVGRLHDVLSPKSRDAAKRAAQPIRQSMKVLSPHPEIGRPVEDLPPELREWVIECGHGG
ncbi:MAG: type II toxin-antitoxin system RelE/ParE family toxin [Gammaproteobacteria bacterium]